MNLKFNHNQIQIKIGKNNTIVMIQKITTAILKNK